MERWLIINTNFKLKTAIHEETLNDILNIYASLTVPNKPLFGHNEYMQVIINELDNICRNYKRA